MKQPIKRESGTAARQKPLVFIIQTNKLGFATCFGDNFTCLNGSKPRRHSHMSINKHSEASEALNADCTTENQLGSVFPPERKSNIKSSYISGFLTDDQKERTLSLYLFK